MKLFCPLLLVALVACVTSQDAHSSPKNLAIAFREAYEKRDLVALGNLWGPRHPTMKEFRRQFAAGYKIESAEVGDYTKPAPGSPKNGEKVVFDNTRYLALHVRLTRPPGDRGPDGMTFGIGLVENKWCIVGLPR